MFGKRDMVPVRRIMAGLGMDNIGHFLVHNHYWNTDWAAMFQMQCFKIAKLALMPFGATVNEV